MKGLDHDLPAGVDDIISWDDNLDQVLVQYPPVEPIAHRVYLPLTMK